MTIEPKALTHTGILEETRIHQKISNGILNHLEECQPSLTLPHIEPESAFLKCHIEPESAFLKCQSLTISAFLKYQIEPESAFLKCQIEPESAFLKCHIEFVPYSLNQIYHVHIPLMCATKKGWDVQSVSTKIWNESPESIVKKFDQADFLTCFYPHKKASTKVNLIEKDIIFFLKNPQNHTNSKCIYTNDCNVYKCNVKIEKVSKSTGTTYYTMIPISTISWEDSDSVNIVAEVICELFQGSLQP